LSVNLLKNNIGVAQAEKLASILREHPTLKSLCGNSGDETELDMSGKMKGATDAIMLVPEIIGNGALTSLNMSANGLKGAEVGKALGDAIASNTALKELDISGGEYGFQQCDAKFLQLFSVGLRDNGAMMNLDMSGNDFYDTEAGKALGDMLAVNTVLKQLDLSDCNMQIESTKALAVGIRDNHITVHV
jgi:Ran GTPase-activating protein (RanGAP) involved in mRNA processing and transport